MRRRHFIGGIVGTAAARPLPSWGQQPELPLIGILRSSGANNSAHLVTAFRKGLSEAGYEEGRNVAIEFRWAEGRHDRLPTLVSDLISRRVAVIVTNQASAHAVKAATTTVPIIVAGGGDPVRDGLVASLNRPGGNVTGSIFLSSAMGTKRLQILRDLVPSATMVAVLTSAQVSGLQAEQRDVKAAAQALGLQLLVHDVSSDREIEAAFVEFAERGAGGLLIGSGAFMNSHRERLVTLAARNAIPAIYSEREYAVSGGLMSYSAPQSEAYRQAGIYAGRILKGEKPADLPVVLSTRFELVINLKTAKALRIEIPAILLAIADEVIE